jgi:hypothetical protein
MSPQQTQQQSPGTLEGMMKTVMAAMFFVVSILAAPIEMGLRRRQGSRYQHWVVLAFAPIPPLLFMMAGNFAVTQYAVLSGLLGAGTVYLALQVIFWMHVGHVVNVVVHPEKEKSSREDGIGLGLWALLPKGDKWAMVRFVYEPGLVIALGIILPLIHVLSVPAGAYLVFAGVALLVKVTFLFVYAWEYWRNILDEFNISKRMSGKPTQGGMESVREAVMRAASRIPTAAPFGAQMAVQKIAAQSLPPELQGLLSEVKPTATAKPAKGNAFDLLTEV